MQAQATITLPSELTDLIHREVQKTVAQVLQEQDKQQNAPDFLNLGQAADFIQVSRGTLTKLIKLGKIKVIFIGTAKRISKAELNRFMMSKEI